MERPHHLIYLTGLADDKTRGQNLVLNFWRRYGFQPHYNPIGWANGEVFDTKLDRVLKRIDRLARAGGQVSLMGISAGGMAALIAYSRRPENIFSMALICPKINGLEKISAEDLTKNPALGGAVKLLSSSLDLLDEKHRQRVLTVRPQSDNRIPDLEDMVLAGSYDMRLPTHGHTRSIAYAITRASHPIADFLHQPAEVPGIITLD